MERPIFDDDATTVSRARDPLSAAGSSPTVISQSGHWWPSSTKLPLGSTGQTTIRSAERFGITRRRPARRSRSRALSVTCGRWGRPSRRHPPSTCRLRRRCAPRDEGRAMTFIGYDVRRPVSHRRVGAGRRDRSSAPGLPLANVRPMREVVSAAGAQPRFTTFVMSFFAGNSIPARRAWTLRSPRLRRRAADPRNGGAHRTWCRPG